MSNRCNIDQLDKQYNDERLNALHYSANLGYYEIALLLIQEGADIEAKTEPHSLRPLHYAASSGCYEIAKELLDRSAEIDSVDTFGQTALHIAAIKGSYGVAKLLLERGACINAQDHNYYTPLRVAVEHKHLDLCRLLIEFEADTNIRDSHELTALHLAVKQGDQQLVKIILQQQLTDINARTDFDYTALHFAAHSGDIDIVKALMNRGANIDAQDRDQNTAEAVAKLYEKAEILGILEATRELLRISTLPCKEKRRKKNKKPEDLIAKCIYKGASVNARDSMDQTALGNAIQNSNSGLVKLLLKYNADCAIKIDNDSTVLHRAADLNNFNICQLIVDHHAERSSLKERLQFINANDLRGQKALHIASLNGNSSMVRFLIKRGAIYDAVDNEGRTPVDLAKEGIKEQFQLITKTFGQVLDCEDLAVENVRISKHVRKARSVDGYTVFCWAVKHKKIGVVADILEDKSADVDDMTNTDGCTAFHIACRNGDVDIVNRLLDYKESNSIINARTFETGETALHVCANAEVARALIGHGAVYCIKTRNGKTPAESNRNNDVRRLLESIDKAFKDKKLPNDFMAESKVLLNARDERRLTLREVIKGGRRFSDIAKQVILFNRHKDKFAKSLDYLFAHTCSQLFVVVGFSSFLCRDIYMVASNK